MIKFICDKCLEEVSGLHSIPEYVEIHDVHGVVLTEFTKRVYELCNNCHDQFQRLDIDIVDFMEKSKEELNLLDSTFKVGDKVITSTGEMGVITGICDCEKCKKRGFYEPSVKTKIGLYDIYITDNDKKHGFSSFYSIGDHVYGNIDKEGLIKSIKRVDENIEELNRERITLLTQAKVLKKVKKDKEE